MRFVVAILALLIAASMQSPDADLRINQVQIIGTHNSYHAGISPSESKVFQTKYPQFFPGLDYQHPPLTVQLNAGVRQVELDIFADTMGGRYAHPVGPRMAAALNLPADPDPDPKGLMLKPGFKVMHVQDVDYRSNCQPFIACLEEIRSWSHAHPGHIPIFILVETKQGVPKDTKLTIPEPFTAATFDALDAEIRSVFPANELVTPDTVRGSRATLNEAVTAHDWPTLDSARGKIVFLLDQRSVGPLYLVGHPSLRGRVLFTNAEPGQPDAAFIELNEGPEADITALVREGYLIRARTDADTKQARTNDTSLRDGMIASGAQILSTDYPANEPARWAGHFSVALPDNAVARCNPTNGTHACTLK